MFESSAVVTHTKDTGGTDDYKSYHEFKLPTITRTHTPHRMTSVLKYWYSECSRWQLGHTRRGLFSRSEVEVAGINSSTTVVSCWMADDGEELHGSVSFLWLYAKHPPDLTRTAWSDRHSTTSYIPVLCCSSLPVDSVVLDFKHRHT